MQWLVVYLSGELLLEIRQGATVFFRHHYYPLNKLRSLCGIVPERAAERIKILDGIEPMNISNHFVVG